MSKHHTIYWASSYDRGLDNLLFMWPDIIKKYPDAKLHVCYGWDLFDKANHNNPERMKWKKSVQKMINQKGVIHHGRVGQDKLKEIRSKCGIWAYPTWFPEINCITALECQDDGVVPVTMDDFALSETVGSGIKIKGDINDPKVKDKYLKELLDLMGDKDRWEKEVKKAKKFAKNFYWEKIAKGWDKIFKEDISTPKVSVITLTIRTGWWNIMANNLSKQTYKNFEWIIIDDYKEDRSDIAEKYAKKYDLDIKYIRGDKAKGKYKRKYGLVRANNISWEVAEGDLLVYLQDFILIPDNGLERIVGLHRHHPDALIAPVDQYYFATEANRDNKEDWWDGEINIIDEFSWRNNRVMFNGIRKSDSPYEFEMNYAGIPKHIIEDLNGWWEYYDDALGFDNTEIAFRALERGYELIVDDTNEAVCINLWPIIGGEKENIAGRERNLAIPHYFYMLSQMEKGNMPVVRDEKLDNSLSLKFEVPEEIPDEECDRWLKENGKQIVKDWGDIDA